MTPGFMDTMWSTYECHPKRDKIAIVMPRYKNRETGRIGKPSYIASDGAPLEVMTSGSLFPCEYLIPAASFGRTSLLTRWTMSSDFV